MSEPMSSTADTLVAQALPLHRAGQVAQAQALYQQALAAALETAAPEAARLLNAEKFAPAMAALATLRAPLDAFFDKVLVNEPQFRRNRLALLARLRTAMDSVADLAKIEG